MILLVRAVVPQAASAEVAQKSASLEQLRGQLAGARGIPWSSERNQSAVMNALQQALESGQIPGIFGRLGDLAGIDGTALRLHREASSMVFMFTLYASIAMC